MFGLNTFRKIFNVKKHKIIREQYIEAYEDIKMRLREDIGGWNCKDGKAYRNCVVVYRVLFDDLELE